MRVNIYYIAPLLLLITACSNKDSISKKISKFAKPGMTISEIENYIGQKHGNSVAMMDNRIITYIFIDKRERSSIFVKYIDGKLDRIKIKDYVNPDKIIFDDGKKIEP